MIASPTVCTGTDCRINSQLRRANLAALAAVSLDDVIWLYLCAPCIADFLTTRFYLFQLLLNKLYKSEANQQACDHQTEPSNEPAVELVGIFLASFVEVQTELGVDADAKVVVHDKDGCRVFVLLSRLRVVSQRHFCLVRFLLIRMKYYCPSIQLIN